MHWKCRVLYTWLYITDSNLLNFNRIFGNFGLYLGVPEVRNMSTIEDEEVLYQNLKNLSWTSVSAGHFLEMEYINKTIRRTFCILTEPSQLSSKSKQWYESLLIHFKALGHPNFGECERRISLRIWFLAFMSLALAVTSVLIPGSSYANKQQYGDSSIFQRIFCLAHCTDADQKSETIVCS